MMKCYGYNVRIPWSPNVGTVLLNAVAQARASLFLELSRVMEDGKIYSLKITTRQQEYRGDLRGRGTSLPFTDVQCTVEMQEAETREMLRIVPVPVYMPERVPSSVTWGGVWTAIKKLWRREAFEW